MEMFLSEETIIASIEISFVLRLKLKKFSIPYGGNHCHSLLRLQNAHGTAFYNEQRKNFSPALLPISGLMTLAF